MYVPKYSSVTAVLRYFLKKYRGCRLRIQATKRERGCTYQAMPRIPGLFGTLIPGPNPYLPMAFGYRQGIPNPYSLRYNSGRFPLK